MEGVDGGDAQAVAVVAHHEEGGPLQGLDPVGLAHHREQLERHRFGQGHELEDLPAGVVEGGEPAGDQVVEQRRGLGRAGEPPQPGGLLQGAGRQRPLDHLPEVERVPLADVGQAAGRPALDRAAQHGLQQVDHVVAGQDVEPDRGEGGRGEQGGDRRAERLAGAPGRDHRDVAPLEDLVEHRGRGVVEVVGVVDVEDGDPDPGRQGGGDPLEGVGGG